MQLIYSCCPQLVCRVFAWFDCSGHARLAKRLIPFGWFELLTPPLGARVVFVDGLCALRSRTQLSSLLCLAPLLLVCRVQFTTFPPRRCFGVEIWAGGHDVFLAAAQSAVGASVDMVIFSECPFLFDRAECFEVDFAHHRVRKERKSPLSPPPP